MRPIAWQDSSPEADFWFNCAYDSFSKLDITEINELKALMKSQTLMFPTDTNT